MSKPDIPIPKIDREVYVMKLFISVEKFIIILPTKAKESIAQITFRLLACDKNNIYAFFLINESVYNTAEHYNRICYSA